MCAETSFLQVLNNKTIWKLLDTLLFWVSLKPILWWYLTCDERLMSVVTTSTMTITVSNTLDKPTRGSTLE